MPLFLLMRKMGSLYGTWHNGVWFKGVLHKGVWHNGTWHEGAWRDGEWRDGYSCLARNRWKIFRNKDSIRIGCKIKTISEWEEWFAGNERYSARRGTSEFKRIHNAFLLAKYEYELEEK